MLRNKFEGAFVETGDAGAIACIGVPITLLTSSRIVSIVISFLTADVSTANDGEEIASITDCNDEQDDTDCGSERLEDVDDEEMFWDSPTKLLGNFSLSNINSLSMLATEKKS